MNPFRAAARRLSALLLSASFAASAGAADMAAPDAPAKPETATELDGVTVTGKRNPLEDADRRRREMIDKLPELGAGRARDKGRGERLADWYKSLPKDVNQLNPDSQEFLDRTLNNPDTNHAADYETGPRRDGADYIDPLAQP